MFFYLIYSSFFSAFLHLDQFRLTQSNRMIGIELLFQDNFIEFEYQ